MWVHILMNLFQSQHGISVVLIAIATLQATFSNNVLKAVYGAILSENETRKKLYFGFGIIIFLYICSRNLSSIDNTRRIEPK